MTNITQLETTVKISTHFLETKQNSFLVPGTESYEFCLVSRKCEQIVTVNLIILSQGHNKAFDAISMLFAQLHFIQKNNEKTPLFK